MHKGWCGYAIADFHRIFMRGFSSSTIRLTEAFLFYSIMSAHRAVPACDERKDGVCHFIPSPKTKM